MSYTEEQIRNMSWGEKRYVAQNPNTPPRALEVLSKDVDEEVRWRVALNPNTPVEVLKELSRDEDEDVREAVAKHSKSTDRVLKELSKDKVWNIREIVANNPNSTDRVLVSVFEYERKRKRPDRDILEAIIDNANCPGYLKAVIQTMLDGME
jgi:hypothetical protein